MKEPERATGSWRSAFSGWPLMLVLLVASLALGDATPLVALDRAIRNHQLVFLGITGAVALIGFILFFIGAFLLMLDNEAAPTADETGDQQVRGLAGLRRLPQALRGSVYRFSGTASTVQAQDTFSLAELKRVGADRWSDPVSRRRTIAVIGGIMMVFGGFACAFVAVPAGLKPLIGVFVLYALVRLIWGYYKAR
jgi:hypothetical protein